MQSAPESSDEKQPASVASVPQTPLARGPQNDGAHHLPSKSWSHYAMTVHATIAEVQEICQQGGLQNPQATQRVQTLRQQQLLKLYER